MSKRVCVIGNLNADLVLSPLEDFPIWGSEVITSHMGWRPGGIGNVLLSLARLGVEVSVIANVGDDAIGQELLSILEEAKVDISHIERSLNVRTGISVCLGREDGERAFVTHLGHLKHLDIDLVLRHRKAWKETQCVLISGYFLLPSLGFAGTKRLIEEAHAESKRVLFDTGWDVKGWPERSVEEVMQLIEEVDIFLPSLNEAQVLTGETSPEGCLEALFARCPNQVIIKLGAAGSIAKTKEGIFHQSAFRVLPLDTTGAGDCFNTGVIFGLLRGWDTPQILRFANALAAIVISRQGKDRYPALSEVEEYLHKGQ
ncbi:MAG: carbohydrate kinase family protein [Anaerolineae bacterium]|nr:carbohydrate kinase family protein [Anaerolineae bacterium]